MKILKLKLKNFQGVTSAEYDFGGENVSFLGENGTGKSTVFNAYTWLIFGKSADDAASFSPKPQKDGAEVHNLETRVEMTFSHDGEEHVMTRVLSEVWKHERGNATPTFGGNKTTFLFDGIEISAKDFSGFFDKIANATEFKSLTLPLYFCDNDQLPWVTRRKILFDLRGELTDIDVINSTADLAELPDLLGGKSVENFKLSLAEPIKIAKKELSAFPKQIEEAGRVIPENLMTLEDVERNLDIWLNSKKIAEEELQNAQNSDTAELERHKKIAEIETKIAKERNNYFNAACEVSDKLHAEIQSAEKEFERLSDIMLKANKEDDELYTKLFEIDEKRREIQEKISEIKAEVFDENSQICPACNRPFSQEEIENSEIDFENRKKTRVDELIATGKKRASIEMRENAQKAYENAHETLIKAEQNTDNALEFLNSLRQKSKGNSEISIKFEETEKYSELKQKLDALINISSTNNSLANNQNNLIHKLKENISELNIKLTILKLKNSKLRWLKLKKSG